MTRCSGIACIADDCKRHSFEGELYCGEHGGPPEYLTDELAVLIASDPALAERSVTVQAAYAFGDWPPAGLLYDSPTRVAMRPAGGDR